MPTNLQKLVRARMGKTGERYSTALRYVRQRARKTSSLPEAAAPPAAKPLWIVRHSNAVPRDPRVDAYVESQSGPLHQTIARLVRAVRAAVPAHDEVVVHGAPWFCVHGEPFCYVVGYAKHVNLGFCEGAFLDDPDGLLEGTGKQMRHVKLSPSREVPSEKLAHLVSQSARRVRARQSQAKGREARHGRS
jgi:hypothetical protein